jgi:hypothetical protein
MVAVLLIGVRYAAGVAVHYRPLPLALALQFIRDAEHFSACARRP